MRPLFLQSEGHSRFKVIFSKIIQSPQRRLSVMLSTDWQGKMLSKILNLLLLWAWNDLNLVLHSIWVQVRYHPYTWEVTQVIISVAFLHISFISGSRKLHNKVAILHDMLSHIQPVFAFFCSNSYYYYFTNKNLPVPMVTTSFTLGARILWLNFALKIMRILSLLYNFWNIHLGDVRGKGH